MEPERVEVFETYPALLSRDFEGVLNVGYGFATSKEILWQSGYFKSATNPGIYIFNFGIVDCTPRGLTSKESWILKKMGIRLPSAIIEWLRRNRTIRYVPPDQFRFNCESIKNLGLGELIILSIAPASVEFERVAPGISKSICIYNGILKDIFGRNYCKIDFDMTQDIMSDYHHLTVSGHRRVFNRVKDRVAEMLKVEKW
jgi:hypothetical protein